jgi:hypothetical protein
LENIKASLTRAHVTDAGVSFDLLIIRALHKAGILPDEVRFMAGHPFAALAYPFNMHTSNYSKLSHRSWQN